MSYIYDVSGIQELIDYFNDFEGTDEPIHAELTLPEVSMVLEALEYYKGSYKV